MKRTIAAIVLASSVSLIGAPAFAAEQHPGQFNGGNPHDKTQCSQTANHPNCPGKF